MSASRAAAPDLVWIERDLALGSKPYAHQRDQVVAAGIGSVLTLDEPTEAEVVAWHLRGVRFVALPTIDWVAIPTVRFDRAVALVAAERAAGHAVLLHCLAGQNRAPTVAAAALCHARGIDVDEALVAIRAQRRISAPTEAQAESLRRWVDLRCTRGVPP